MSRYLFEDVDQILQQELKNFPAAAVTSTEGESLSVKPLTPADLGTLSAAAQTSFKYLQIKPGEVVLMNDPYSGGSILSTMTLLTGIKLVGGVRKATNDSDLLLATRLPLKPRVHLAKSIDGEGLRIPPTPIVHGGQLNRELLKAISQHPECPAQFEAFLLTAIENLQRAADSIGRRLGALTNEAPKKWLKDYFVMSRDQAYPLIHDLTVGEAREEITLDDGSRLSLRIEISDHGVQCDFTGSSASKRYHLTDSATFGVCAAAVYAFLDAQVPYNYGTLEPIHVTAPSGTLVNARSPAPVFLGFTDGTEIVASLVVRVLNKIDRRRQVAQSGVSQCAFHMEYEGGQYFYDFLVPGSGASSSGAGASGVEIWKRTQLRPSVEEVERRYPLIVRSISYRHKSGGSGQLVGGEGVTKVIETLQPTKLKWALSEAFRKPEGISGGKAGIGPEILVMDKDGEKRKLSEQGEESLSAGQQVVVHSGGGGGFGESEKSTT